MFLGETLGTWGWAFGGFFVICVLITVVGWLNQKVVDLGLPDQDSYLGAAAMVFSIIVAVIVGYNMADFICRGFHSPGSKIIGGVYIFFCVSGAVSGNALSTLIVLLSIVVTVLYGGYSWLMG